MRRRELGASAAVAIAAVIAAGVLLALPGGADAGGLAGARDAITRAADAAAGQAQPDTRPAQPGTRPAQVQIQPEGDARPLRPGEVRVQRGQGGAVQIQRGGQPGQIQVRPGQPGGAAGQPGAPGTLGAPGAPGTGADAGPPEALNRGAGAAVFFWLFALMIVSGSIFVITRSNLITAVMGMVGTFFGIAAVFAMLYATFLTAIQVLVYAGAIMVLFVFVIMILNKPEAEPWRVHAGAREALGKLVVPGVALAYLFVRLASVLWSIAVDPSQLAPPGSIPLASVDTATGAPILTQVDFGSTKALGNTLFGDYLFPFEAVSLVLLIAVVGAVAVARPHEKPPRATAAGPDGDGAGGDQREA